MEACRTKMEVGENGGEEDAAACMEGDLILVVPSPLAIVFTKMSFCHS